MSRLIPRRIALALIASAATIQARAEADDAALLERNPLLRDIGRIAPDRLPWFLAQLNAILGRSGLRGGKPPGKEPPLTPGQRADVNANPDIKEALRIDPDRMIAILEEMRRAAARRDP